MLDIKDTKEFEKEFPEVFLKDKSDGQEYCVSEEKHFYLINATDFLKDFIIQDRTKLIEAVIAKTEERLKKNRQASMIAFSKPKNEFYNGVISEILSSIDYWQEALSKLK